MKWILFQEQNQVLVLKWSSNWFEVLHAKLTKLGWKGFKGSFLEHLDNYDNIVSIDSFGTNKFTDEKLMKLKNAVDVDVRSSTISTTGIARWLKITKTNKNDSWMERLADRDNGAKLGACAKMEQQLVRSTSCKIDEIGMESPYIWLKHGKNEITVELTKYKNSFVWKNPTHSDVLNYSAYSDVSKRDDRKVLENVTWKETLLKIFNSIGSKILVGKFAFKVTEEFQTQVEWLRKNVNLHPTKVEAKAKGCMYGIENINFDPFLEWPQNVKISCSLIDFNGSFLENLNNYDNIVSIDSSGTRKFTNVKLLKLKNAVNVKVETFPLSTAGIARWLKQWLVRPGVDKIHFRAQICEDVFSSDAEIKKELDGFVTGPIDYDSSERYVRLGMTGYTLQNRANGKTATMDLSNKWILIRSD